MATPSILNITVSSNNNTANVNYPITYPAYNANDLIIICVGTSDIGADPGPTKLIAPAGPNNEVISTFGQLQWWGSSEQPQQRASVFYYIAAATRTSATLTFTNAAISAAFGAAVFRVAANNFNYITPLSANSRFSGNRSAATTAQVTTWTADYNDNQGLYLVWGCTNSDNLNTSSVTTGWSYDVNTDVGSIGIWLARRTANVSSLEVFAANTFTINLNASRTSSTIGFIIKPDTGIFSVNTAGYGTNSNEFDFNDSNVVIRGAGFGASQGSSKVYLSENSTLAGGATEVDISSAITAWSNNNITLNLQSTNLQTSLDSLNVPSLYLIADIGPGTEYPLQVQCHRAKAFFMYDSTNIASETSTTAQLTAPSGKTTSDFDGGRLTESNPTTTGVAMTTDDYREDEFSIIANTTNAVLNETYQFKVTLESSTIYITNLSTFTANLTITAAAARNSGFIF